MADILDPKFKYIDSHHTDIRKTFARVRKEQRERAAVPAPTARVVTLKQRGK